MVLLGIVILIGVPSMGESKKKAEVKALANILAEEMRLARQKAITKQVPVGVAFPSDRATKAHCQSYYILEGDTAKLKKVANYKAEYPSSYIFNGFWDVDTSKLQNPSSTTTNAQPRTGSNYDNFDVRSWGGTRFKDSKDFLFLFTPAGTVKTNNLPNFDGNFHIVVAKGVAYQLAAVPSSALLDEFMLCFANVDQDNPNQYFKLMRMTYPCFTINISPLGEINVSEGITGLLESSVQVQSIEMSPPSSPPEMYPEPNVNPVIDPANGTTITPAPNPATLPEGVDATVTAGQTLSFEVKATDSNADTLYCLWTCSGGAITVTGENQMEWDEAENAWISRTDWVCPASGWHFNIKYTINDNRGGSATGTKVVGIIGPDKVTFASSRDGGTFYEVYEMNADGTGQTRLTTCGCGPPNAVSNWQPTLSGDGTRIAFASSRDSGIFYEVYGMNMDGTGLKRLTTSGCGPPYAMNNWQPAFSGDGTRIAFASSRDGGAFWEIYVMNADGSDQRRLTTCGCGPPYAVNNWQPTFSSDGKKIAFASSRDGGTFWEIYVMNEDGTGQTRLTTNGGSTTSNWEPHFVCDGKKIAFASSRDGGTFWEIYVMNTDGTGQMRLTTNGGPSVTNLWGAW
jgi:type II secretory pathway pseudopilin PulG